MWTWIIIILIECIGGYFRLSIVIEDREWMSAFYTCTQIMFGSTTWAIDRPAS